MVGGEELLGCIGPYGDHAVFQNFHTAGIRIYRDVGVLVYVSQCVQPFRVNSVWGQHILHLQQRDLFASAGQMKRSFTTHHTAANKDDLRTKLIFFSIAINGGDDIAAMKTWKSRKLWLCAHGDDNSVRKEEPQAFGCSSTVETHVDLVFFYLTNEVLAIAIISLLNQTCLA